MKRTGILFLITLYLTASVGFTAYSHLCKGVLQNVSVGYSADSESCPDCSESHSGHVPECCKKVQKEYKLGDEILLAKKIEFKFKYGGETVGIPFSGLIRELVFGIENRRKTEYHFYNYTTAKNPLYIFHCVYRI